MATVPYVKTDVQDAGRTEGAKITWSNMANGDIGQAYEKALWSDRSAQVTGTFSVGGNARILGSIDGTNYSVLTDPQGNALDITATKIEAISEATLFVKPQITAGDGSTSLTVTVLLVRKYR